jgi:hypothetical protein
MDTVVLLSSHPPSIQPPDHRIRRLLSTALGEALQSARMSYMRSHASARSARQTRHLARHHRLGSLFQQPDASMVRRYVPPGTASASGCLSALQPVGGAGENARSSAR